MAILASELIEVAFGVAAATDSPAEEGASASGVTTVGICASVAEDNADLISEVTMTVVRLADSPIDICPLPRLSATAGVVEMT